MRSDGRGTSTGPDRSEASCGAEGAADPGRWRETLAAAVIAAAVAACSGGFGPGDSDSILVHGRVTGSASGRPVVGADVDVTIFSPNCGSDLFSGASDRTDSAGRYAATVLNFRTTFGNNCVEVRATPPEGSGLGSRVVPRPGIDLSGDRAVDSVEVNVALDSASSG